MEVIKKPSNKIQIKHGNGTHDPEEFIELYRLLSNDKKKIRLLSPVLVEIIDNSVQHAYSMNNVFKGKEWYFFTEEKENKFEFILLDTGVGIPKTMKRNFKDFVNSIMSSNTESSILKSGFLGAFRTGTGEKNRGNGLPKIFDGVQSGVLSNMEILTEKAYCCIKKGGLIEANDKNNKFNGTLYRWEILKEDLM